MAATLRAPVLCSARWRQRRFSAARRRCTVTKFQLLNGPAGGLVIEDRGREFVSDDVEEIVDQDGYIPCPGLRRKPVRVSCWTSLGWYAADRFGLRVRRHRGFTPTSAMLGYNRPGRDQEGNGDRARTKAAEHAGCFIVRNATGNAGAAASNVGGRKRLVAPNSQQIFARPDRGPP